MAVMQRRQVLIVVIQVVQKARFGSTAWKVYMGCFFIESPLA